jgi:hypothetical protein
MLTLLCQQSAIQQNLCLVARNEKWLRDGVRVSVPVGESRARHRRQANKFGKDFGSFSFCPPRILSRVYRSPFTPPLLNPPPLQILSDLRPVNDHHNPQPPKKNERAKIPNSKSQKYLAFPLYLAFPRHQRRSTPRIIENTS